MRVATVISVVLIGCLLSVQGQTSVGVTPDMRTAANDAYQKQDWDAAIKAYEKIVSMEDKNAGARYRLGVSLLGVKRNEDAARQLETALSISANPVFSLALARAYARSGNSTKMYEALEGSLKTGGIQPELITGEIDFASFKSDPKFIAFVDKTDKIVNPCKAKPEFRQFDFWIGEWTAKNTQGLTVGTSSIQLILGTCTIFENWSGGSGTNGKSFNIYDVNDNKWHQTWVDDKGTFSHYIGGTVDGKMVVVADTIVNGKKTLAKMTFSKLPNGDVRQHGENSTDDGKTWTTSFDFTYVRKT